MKFTPEEYEELEREAGVNGGQKLNYVADAIELSGKRWPETPPAFPGESAAKKIRNIAAIFEAEPDLPFSALKKFRDFEAEYQGVEDVEAWFKAALKRELAKQRRALKKFKEKT